MKALIKNLNVKSFVAVLECSTTPLASELHVLQNSISPNNPTMTHISLGHWRILWGVTIVDDPRNVSMLANINTEGAAFFVFLVLSDTSRLDIFLYDLSNTKVDIDGNVSILVQLNDFAQTVIE